MTEKDYSAQQTQEEKRELRLKYRNLFESIKQQPEAAGNNSYDDDEENACKETDTDTLLNSIRLSNALFANGFKIFSTHLFKNLSSENLS